MREHRSHAVVSDSGCQQLDSSVVVATAITSPEPTTIEIRHDDGLPG